MKTILLTVRHLALLCCLLAVVSAAASEPAKPEVWMMPPFPKGSNEAPLRELFTHPEQWSQTREKIDVLGCTDLNLRKHFTADELKTWLPLMDQWGLKLGLEVGAVKPWGQTGDQTFAKETNFWDQIITDGGKIYAFAMDEPLVCTRFQIHKPDDYAVRETARYIQLVRQRYPQALIGDIEGYPSIPLADHLAWINALQARLKELNVRGLDFYRLDVDWTEFIVYPKAGRPGNWSEVKQLELACRKQGIPFSLIYWAAPYPALNRRALADDSTWYLNIMNQGYDYALVGGKPDQYVLESWIGVPTTTLPETSEWTFTRSVLDFYNRFLSDKK